MIFPRSLQATLLLTGTIVGVGMFGIPFVFARAGFLTGLVELVFLAAAVTAVHCAYAEVVLRTAAVHRLPGYVAQYLGKPASWLARVSYLFGISGALLAYVVIGGLFLGALLRYLLPTVAITVGPAVFYLIGITVIAQHIRGEGFTNAILTAALVVAVLVLALPLLPLVSWSALTAFHPGALALPYGVILFALAGATVIPDVRRLLGDSGSLGRVVARGSIAAALLYLVFATAVVGVSGEATTPDAITGLAHRFGQPYLILGSLIGFLAAITSFVGLGLALKGMFVSDLGIWPRAAWALTAMIPLALYLAGLRDFIAIIDAVGAIAIGVDSILILLVHRVAVRAGGASGLWPAITPYLRVLLMLVFALGILHGLRLLF